MVEKTLKLYECDVCGTEGERYTITYPDGMKTLDRCERHNSKLLKLKEEKGEWVVKAPGARSGFKVSSIEEIERQKS